MDVGAKASGGLFLAGGAGGGGGGETLNSLSAESMMGMSCAVRAATALGEVAVGVR